MRRPNRLNNGSVVNNSLPKDVNNYYSKNSPAFVLEGSSLSNSSIRLVALPSVDSSSSILLAAICTQLVRT